MELLGPVPQCELLGCYSQMDLALDPFPYNGGTTTCEALAMGVPVLTLRGDRFVSRVGASLLANAGLEDLIAATAEEYAAKAVALAANPALLSALRPKLRGILAHSTVCDVGGFTRKLESAYRDIWRRWCAARRAA